MSKPPKHILGLMSGTSLDGLDLALCRFNEDQHGTHFKILHATTQPYNKAQREFLAHTLTDPAPLLLSKHISFAKWVGKAVVDFLKKHPAPCALIASHGHTVHHQPNLGYTFQLGDGQTLANYCNIPVLSNFRAKDIALGGQGAPLVPIGDLNLFPNYKYCLNLGGISNISIKTKTGILAYDIGLANILLNYLAAIAGQPYDKNGTIAASGTFNPLLFKKLNELDYYKQSPPKSLGIEWFNTTIKPILDGSSITLKDKLHTATHHIAYQIYKSIKKESQSYEKILVTGGGAKNTYLISCVEKYTKGKVKVVIPPTKIIDFKEALIFAYMAYLNSKGEINCLKSVTGAKKDSTAGYIYYP